MNTYIVPVIGGLIIAAIGLVSLYLKERTKNLATKHDLQEVTEITESVKIEFNRQIEELKAQLSLNNQLKINLKNEQRLAFIDFNKRISDWLYMLVRVSPSGYNLTNFEDILEIDDKLDEKHMAYDLADSHLYLFHNERSFVELNSEIGRLLVDLNGFVSKFIIDVRGVYSKHKIIINHATPEGKKEAHENLYAELRTLLEAFYTTRVEKFGIIHRKLVQLQKKIQVELMKIDEDAGQ